MNAPVSALSLHDRPSPEFDAKVARSIALLQRAAAEHGARGPLTQASSLGAEDIVVTHLIHQAGIKCGVFVLDTGKLHPETLALIPQLEARYGQPVEIYRPVQEATVHFVRDHGERAMYESLELRKACCHIRKMEPLGRALAGKAGWITGLRREQSAARAEVPDIEADGERVKINPLADWSWGDVWHYIGQHQLEYNALHDRFFPSIGCEPCTRAISLGEDFRSGRWWWEQESAKECGLHVQATSSPLKTQGQLA